MGQSDSGMAGREGKAMTSMPLFLLLAALSLVAPHLTKSEGIFFGWICMLSAVVFIGIETFLH